MSRRVTACALAGALVAGTTALTACQRDAVAEVPPAALVTQRVRGTISGPPDAPRWTPCADDTSGARAVDRSAALDSARAALAPPAGDTLFADLEAGVTPAGALEIAVIHRLVRGADRLARCSDARAEVDVVGNTSPSWRARFSRDTLTIVHEGSAAAESTVYAATRAPAVDGSILYRARTALGDTVTVMISPLVEQRGLRAGTAQVSRRAVGCVSPDGASWSNATATLITRDTRQSACAAYAAPLRDPARRRRSPM